MSNQEIKSFLNAVDNAKLKTKPLPKSYISDKADDYTKGLYATVLASLLVAKGVISDEENRLFRLILDSIGLEEDVSYFVNNVSQMTSKQVLDLLENLDTDDKRLNLLFEALLLARIHSPITDTQLKVLDEICSLFELDQDDIKLLIFWLKIFMGLQNQYLKDELNQVVEQSISVKIEQKKLCEVYRLISINSFVDLGSVIGYFTRTFDIVFLHEHTKHCYGRGWMNIDEIKHWYVNKDSSVKKDEYLVKLYLGDDDWWIKLKSPVDGIVTKLYKKEGESIHYDEVLATILENAKPTIENQIVSKYRGVLTEFEILNENKIKYSILPLPTYLNNWADSIKTLMEG